MFDHILSAIPSKYFEMSPSRLYLLRGVFYVWWFGGVLFLRGNIAQEVQTLSGGKEGTVVGAGGGILEAVSAL